MISALVSVVGSRLSSGSGSSGSGDEEGEGEVRGRMRIRWRASVSVAISFCDVVSGGLSLTFRSILENDLEVVTVVFVAGIELLGRTRL
jgi:hypothetical protein